MNLVDQVNLLFNQEMPAYLSCEFCRGLNSSRISKKLVSYVCTGKPEGLVVGFYKWVCCGRWAAMGAVAASLTNYHCSCLNSSNYHACAPSKQLKYAHAVPLLGQKQCSCTVTQVFHDSSGMVMNSHFLTFTLFALGYSLIRCRASRSAWA